MTMFLNLFDSADLIALSPSTGHRLEAEGLSIRTTALDAAGHLIAYTLPLMAENGDALRVSLEGTSSARRALEK